MTAFTHSTVHITRTPGGYGITVALEVDDRSVEMPPADAARYFEVLAALCRCAASGSSDEHYRADLDYALGGLS